LNPNKLNVVSNLIAYHKKIKDGLIERKFVNQYDKAEKLGLEKPVVTEKTRKKLSIANKGSLGKGLTNEIEQARKEKISKSLIGNQRSKGRGTRILYKGYTLRSTWEYKVALYLDKNNIEWDYEVCCYQVSETETYRPDFFIYENGLLQRIIEVKGYWYKNNKVKFENFKQKFNIEIELWDKEKLQNLQLL
jgi:hypothetical protein